MFFNEAFLHRITFKYKMYTKSNKTNNPKIFLKEMKIFQNVDFTVKFHSRTVDFRLSELTGEFGCSDKRKFG